MAITRRKDGRWEARYTVHTAAGAKRKVLYDKTRAGVSAKLTKAMADRDGGIVYDAGSITVGEYLNGLLKDSLRGTVRTSTVERHEINIRVHIVPVLGRLKLKVLTPANVRGLHREKLDEGVARPPSARSTRPSTRRLRKQWPMG